MSHITKQQVSIENPNARVFERAVRLMVSTIPELEMVEHIADYYGKRQNIKQGFGVKHKNSQWGQNIYIKDGQIVVEGENMDDNTRNFLTRQIKQFYNAIASQDAMRQMNMACSMNYANGKITLRGKVMA